MADIRERRRRGTVSADDLIGLPLYDMLGEPFGRIGDLVIEIERGMAAYIMVDCDNGRRCALPYELIQIEDSPLRVHTNIHRDVFLAAHTDAGDN